MKENGKRVVRKLSEFLTRDILYKNPDIHPEIHGNSKH